MESLLCDEVWLMSPEDHDVHVNNEEEGDTSFFYSTKEECEQAFGILLEKEMSYMPKPDYVKRIKENCFIENARFKAIYWLIKVNLNFIFLHNTFIFIFILSLVILKLLYSVKGGGIYLMKLYLVLQVTLIVLSL